MLLLKKQPKKKVHGTQNLSSVGTHEKDKLDRVGDLNAAAALALALLSTEFLSLILLL